LSSKGELIRRRNQERKVFDFDSVSAPTSKPATVVLDEKPLIDWFSEIQTQTDQQQNFGYWDPTEEFSRQAAMQQSLQDQLQQTNMMLNAVPNATQPMISDGYGSNPFASRDPFVAFSTPASPPLATVSSSTTPAMHAHNPFGSAVSTSGVPSQVASSAHNPFIFNSNSVPSSKQVDTSFNVESVFGPGSPASVQSFPTPVPAFPNTQSMTVPNHDPFSAMKPFATPGLQNQISGSNTPANFMSPPLGSSTPAQMVNRPPYTSPMTSMSAPNPFMNSNLGMGPTAGSQMNNFGMIGNSAMTNANMMNSGFNINGTSNNNPFASQNQMNLMQPNPFGNHAGLSSGPIYGQNTGSNQGSVISNFHVQSSNLNNSLGSFSATASPNPTQGNQYPRGMPVQQNNAQAFNGMPSTNTSAQHMTSNQNPFAYP
jgi:hypothetical protein